MNENDLVEELLENTKKKLCVWRKKMKEKIQKTRKKERNNDGEMNGVIK